ncbi:hypothetical protein [Gemella sp.]
MNNKSEYGKILKQQRLERGLKLKEVAGDIISTQTLRCFEADETSILLIVFEKLIF